MGVLVATGTIVVLATWIVVAMVVVALGRWAALLTDPDRSPGLLLRSSLWWGLSVLAVTTLLLGQVSALGAPQALWVVLGLALVLLGVGWLIRRPHPPRIRRAPATVTLLLASLWGAGAYLAFKALGPVTNYDSGLYHLGAVAYTDDFGAVPGLANLSFPFGYATVQFPLAAMLGSGPWDGLGYRLLNGMILVLVLADVSVRLRSTRHRWGSYVLVIGLTASLVPLVAMADALVTSPTSDTSVLLLTLVCSAYLADLLQLRRPRATEAFVVLLTAALLVALRPTMLAYAGAVITVLAAVLIRRRRTSGVRAVGWAAVSAITLLLAVGIVLRDRTLSGWLLYPLSVWSFDVPWLAADPTPWRDATLAAARDPGAADHYVVAHSWGWITAWIERLPRQWESWFLVVGVIATVAIAVYARRNAGFLRRPRRLAAALVPGVVAVGAWFLFSPPSFRFIWGPLFSILVIILAAAVNDLRLAGSNLGRVRALDVLFAGCAAVVILVSGYSAIARNQADAMTERIAITVGPLSIPIAIAPVPTPPVTEVALPSGLVVTTPEVGSDQCWSNYPMCTFVVDRELAPRGSSLQDGFTRQ